MYLYCEPRGGITDCFNVIYNAIEYCNKYNKILLVNGNNTCYGINFSDYFNFTNPNIICDKNKIESIISNPNYTIYPPKLQGKLLDIFHGRKKIIYIKKMRIYRKIVNVRIFCCDGAIVNLPNEKHKADIIICSNCGGGPNGYKIFKQLVISDKIKKICKERYEQLIPPYLCIQIRNTDYKCDYEKLYQDNKDFICSFNEIYVATDDKNIITYFKDKNLPIKNFTTFPLTDNYTNLHYSDLNSDTKIIDLFSDIYIITRASHILSNSNGGFIKFVKECNANKDDIINQFS